MRRTVSVPLIDVTHSQQKACLYEKNCDDNYQSVPFIDVKHSQQNA